MGKYQLYAIVQGDVQVALRAFNLLQVEYNPAYDCSCIGFVVSSAKEANISSLLSNQVLLALMQAGHKVLPLATKIYFDQKEAVKVWVDEHSEWINAQMQVVAECSQYHLRFRLESKAPQAEVSIGKDYFIG